MASQKSAEASTITSLNARGDRHPLAGAKMTGAEMVVQVLADEGVDGILVELSFQGAA